MEYYDNESNFYSSDMKFTELDNAELKIKNTTSTLRLGWYHKINMKLLGMDTSICCKCGILCNLNSSCTNRYNAIQGSFDIYNEGIIAILYICDKCVDNDAKYITLIKQNGKPLNFKIDSIFRMND